jgi:hypothetical protein
MTGILYCIYSVYYLTVLLIAALKSENIYYGINDLSLLDRAVKK